jgi:H+/Cl- antiporter ClcA
MRKKLSASRLTISFIAIFTSLSPFLADFNETHVFNPLWPPHAKFHNGQTMTLGLICGIISIYFLWLRKVSTDLENLKMSCLFAALYWLAMAPAILYPGAAFADPEYGGLQTLRLGSIQITQVYMDFLIFIILGICYSIERKQLKKALRIS